MGKLRHAPVAILATLLSPHALAADWKFIPTVQVEEIYTDNLTLVRDDLARSQFITEITPGFSLSTSGPRLELRSTYQLHYFHFKDRELSGTSRSQNQFSADAKAKLVDEFLYLDTAASIGQQAISAFGPQVNDNDYATANRSKVKTYRVSPYLVHGFGAFANAELRYVRDSVESGTIGLGTSDSDSVSLGLASGAAFRRITWGANYSRQKIDDSIAQETTSELSSVNLRYLMSPSFSLTATSGYDKYDYQSLGGETKGASWTGGFVWTPGIRTSVQASAGKRYFGSTYTLAATHRSRHSVWSINYNDAVTTTRSQFLLPATVDTAAMLDRLFMANIPDPVERQRAVEAYILAAGLPRSLADSINYFSNRYMLQKQFQASAAFNTARSTLVFSVFNTRREALSSVQTDSTLLGSNLSNLNDNTHQIGASVLATWQMTARTGLNISATASDTESNSTGLSGDNKALRIALTRQIQPNMRGAVELRRVHGSVGLGAGNYRETALTASLSIKL